VPPDETVKLLMEALQNLRDAMDGLLATFCEDDACVLELYPFVDAADEALEKLGKWLVATED
jgi:hypothetical protein